MLTEKGHDGIAFFIDPIGLRPSPQSAIALGTGNSYGLIYDGAHDLSVYSLSYPSIGYMFISDIFGQYQRVAVGLFDTTRPYLNTTACGTIQGTSMAATHVAGVADLCIARYMNTHGGSYTRTSNYITIINSIINNYDSYGSLTGLISNSRMLNAFKAVAGI
jgi:subtilisin family serine protease